MSSAFKQLDEAVSRSSRSVLIFRSVGAGHSSTCPALPGNVRECPGYPRVAQIKIQGPACLNARLELEFLTGKRTMSDRRGGPRLVASMHPGPAARLYSWKEVAAYLGREERTVRRWEKREGLPVHRLQHGKSGSIFADIAELDAWTARRTDGNQTARRTGAATPPSRSRGVLWGAIAVAVLAAGLGLFLRPRPAGAMTEIPLTSNPGTELDPSLSPDGKQVAYAWDGETHDNFDIYLAPLAGGAPVRLTRNPAKDYSPAWSPDGASVAFWRDLDSEKAAVFIVPAVGGSERMVAEFGVPSRVQWDRPGRFLEWSPDGRWLLAVGRYAPELTDRILRVAIATGEVQPLTSPPAGSMGDRDPAISPDGKTLAYSHQVSWGVSELCLLPLSQDLMPAGNVRRLNTGSAWNTGPAWMDNGTLVFSTGRMLGPHLAKIAIAESAHADRLLGIGEYGWEPSITRSADGQVRLVYTRHFESVNVWRQSLGRTTPLVELISSAHWSIEPDYSADGRRIAFLSDRSGSMEVWVADAEGRHPQQWTFLGQTSLGAPRWSPDSGSIAFTAPGPDGSSIYLVEGPGVAPRLVAGSHRCGYVAWARDGRSIYFSSDRQKPAQIWKIAPEGGNAVQVTEGGGRAPAVSADGRYLYFLRLASAAGEQQLFRVPLAGGSEEKVLDYVDAYSIVASGIAFKYYRAGVQPEGPYLRVFRFSAGIVETLPMPAKPMRYGVALAPGGDYLLHSQADYKVTDLMLVDGLRLANKARAPWTLNVRTLWSWLSISGGRSRRRGIGRHRGARPSAAVPAA